MNRSWLFLCIGLGVLAGILCALSSGAVFMLTVAGITSWVVYRCTPDQARVFLTRLFLAGFLIRVVLSVGLDLGSWYVEKSLPRKMAPAVQGWSLGIEDKTRDYLRLGDSDYYSNRAYAISEFARGSSEPVVLYRVQEYGWNLYPFLMGWFYYTFGFSPFAVKWINAFIGALLGLAIYVLGRQLFHQEKIARWGAILVAFFPSLIFWSATNLKDPSFFLLTALLFIIGIRLQSERPGWKFLMEMILLVVLLKVHLGMNRSACSWVLAACWAISFLWSRLLVVRWRRGPAFVLLLPLLALPFLPWKRFANVHLLGVQRHLSYTLGTGMIYHYLPEKFYRLVEFPVDQIPWAELSMPRFLIYLPKALFHYLLEPLPLQRTVDWLSAAVMPQMIIWYLLSPFMLTGIARSLREGQVARAFFPLATVIGWILLGGISMGNVGTLFRVRDMVTPFLLLYASAGLWVFLNKNKKREVDPLYVHG